MLPPTYLPLLLPFASLLPRALAHPSSPSPLQSRADPPSRALTDCTEGRDEHGLGGNHANWVFQQSFCIRDSAWQAPRYFRKYRIDCRGPGVPSMLQGPVPWHQEAYNIGECAPSQICVDGPYTPPNAALMQMPWYKRHGTAHCVELQHFVHLGQDALHVEGQAVAGGGVAA
ncbi:hypothetical protein MMC17_000576 [Xylographa soralifera]|nr:hypothetical protein [Xylographa soralifera]